MANTYALGGLVVYIISNSVTVCFFISIALYFQAFYEHFVTLANEINNVSTSYGDKENLSDKIQKDITAKETLSEAIRFHVFVKTYVNFTDFLILFLKSVLLEASNVCIRCLS